MLTDLKFALRILLKRPGFSVFAIITLALGIGANSAIFGLVDGVLLKQLHYHTPEQLVWIWSTRKDVSRAFFSIPNFIDTRDQARTIDKLIAFGTWGANLSGRGETERLSGIRVSADIFQMLGVEAAAGRTLNVEDDKPGAGQVIMLSYGLWQRRFGGDPSILGASFTLNGTPYTVVGILPRDFVIPNAETDIVTPLRLHSDARHTERGSNFLRVLARLKPGVTPQQAQLDLTAIADRLCRDFPEDNGNLTAPRVIPLQDELTGAYRTGLLVLLGAVAVVLLIACSNLANLQLARATARRQEIAIRRAIGATRWRLIRQLITEGMLLSLVAGTLGLLIAVWGKDLLVAVAPPDFPRASTLAIDAPVLFFCLGLSAFAAIILGLFPALPMSRTDLISDLKRGGVDSAGSGRRSASNLLVVTEIGFSLVLLISAGLVIKSFRQLLQVNPGFAVDRVVTARFALPSAKYSSGEAVKTFYDKLANAVGSIPGVESVGAVSALPMSALTARTEFVISGRAPAKPSDVPAAQHRWVSASYFRVMRIPVVRGRQFVDQDNERTASVVIVDQALVSRFFGRDDPIGAHIFVAMGDGLPSREYEIVGIAQNVKHNALNEEPMPTFYGPMSQAPKSAVPFLASNFSLVVRSGVEPEALARSLGRELRKIDAGVALSSVKPMEEFLFASIASRKFNLILLAAFAGTALILAATGLYAVIAFLVTHRTREIGVRVALGAQRLDILSLILKQGLRLLVLGLLFGLLGAALTSRLLSSLLFNTSTVDPRTYVSVAVLLSAVALLASYLPARRATKIDPIVALRYE